MAKLYIMHSQSTYHYYTINCSGARSNQDTEANQPSGSSLKLSKPHTQATAASLLSTACNISIVAPIILADVSTYLLPLLRSHFMVQQIGIYNYAIHKTDAGHLHKTEAMRIARRLTSQRSQK
jgi:hypothetical protein